VIIADDEKTRTQEQNVCHALSIRRQRLCQHRGFNFRVDLCEKGKASPYDGRCDF
jgi:hypothetical protein